MNNLAFALRALRSRNYRLFFTGQSISLIGTWMTRIATAWLVYRLTGSAVLLGVVGFAGQIPSFVLAPIAGVWVDRWNRRRTLVVTQILSMLQSFALAVLGLLNVINTWEIVALALCQGLINAFDMPARQAFVVQMVDNREDLSNAIALNSSMVNGARLVGPAIAGMLIAVTNEGWCFLTDGISYIAVIISLLQMRVPAGVVGKAKERAASQLAEGWRYVSGSVPIRSILLLLGLASLMGMPYTVLMPIFASKVLQGGPHTLGNLMAATGVGALCGAMTLAVRRSVVGLGRAIVIAGSLFGGSLVVFGMSRWYWLSLCILPVTGFGMMQQMAASNTIIQTIVEDTKRGRVMAFYSMAVMGMTPLGSLLMGTLAGRFGAPRAVEVGGSACLVGSIWFWWQLPRIRRFVRPIYVKLGIIPEVAEGLSSVNG